MARPAPGDPRSSSGRRRSDYHLLFIAHQQIEQLQLFAARLQQQLRSLQGELEHAEGKLEEAWQLRRVLPHLRERLARLVAAEEKRSAAKASAGALERLSGRIEEFEKAYDARLEAPAGGAEAADLLQQDDPFAGIEPDAVVEEPVAVSSEPAPPPPPEPAIQPAPAPVDSPPAAALPAPAPVDEDRTRLLGELQRVRRQRAGAFAGAGLAAVLAVAAALRGGHGRVSSRGMPEPAAVAPAAAAPAATPAVGAAPGPELSLAEQALRLVKERPVRREGTLGRRLENLTPKARDGRWSAGACGATSCDVVYSAANVDPATGGELEYRFRVDAAAGTVEGMNDPARALLARE